MTARPLLIPVLCFLTACATPDRADSAPGAKLTMVHSVESVSLRVMESFLEQIHVQARGLTDSGGWSGAALRESGAAAGGVYLLEFVAEPPSGMATQALTPVDATITFPKEAGLREVQVISATNRKSAKLP